MAVKFDRVKPGDLITAALLNSLMDEIESLDARVGGGTSGDAVRITRLEPSGEIHVGDELHIFGSGFGAPALTVTIGGVRVEPSESTDAEIVVLVPVIAGLPQDGRDVTVAVGNQRGATATTVRLLPFEPTIPEGNLLVVLTSPRRPTRAGDDLDFVFTISGASNMDETFRITPRLDPATAGWTVAAVDESGHQIEALAIARDSLPAGVSQHVRVGIPNGAASGTTVKLSLAVASRRNPIPFSKSSGDLPIIVDGESPAPQDKVIVSFGNSVVDAQVTGDADHRAVEIKNDDLVEAEIRFDAVFKEPGQYSVAVAFDDPQGWTFLRVRPSSALPIATAPGNVRLSVRLKCAALATETNLNVIVTSAADATITGRVAQRIRPVP